MNLDLSKTIDLRCKEALDFINQRIRSGIKLGLASTLALLDRVGNPHEGMRFIHVAGTNGKGSTCALIAAGLTQCGLRTGFFSSPHLVNFRERYRVDMQPVSETELADLIEEMRDSADDLFGKEQSPSFFEVSTVLGLMHFHKKNCDAVVLEVGMGGRLDATNVVTPALSVITRIDFDHVRPLGDTLTAIAGEKAGIIKRDVPVLVGAQPDEARARIIAQARESHAPVTLYGDDFSADGYEFVPNSLIQRNRLIWKGVNSVLATRFLGPHQLENAATAWAVINRLAELGFNVDAATAAKGMRTVKWPARMDLLADGTLIDAAHNVSGAAVLAGALHTCFSGKLWNLTFGVLETKDWRGMLDLILPFAQNVAFTSFSHNRAADPEDLADYASQRFPGLSVVVEPDLAKAFDWCGEQKGERLVAGSLYMAGEVLARYTGGLPVDVS